MAGLSFGPQSAVPTEAITVKYQNGELSKSFVMWSWHFNKIFFFLETCVQLEHHVMSVSARGPVLAERKRETSRELVFCRPNISQSLMLLLCGICFLPGTDVLLLDLCYISLFFFTPGNVRNDLLYTRTEILFYMPIYRSKCLFAVRLVTNV